MIVNELTTSLPATTATTTAASTLPGAALERQVIELSSLQQVTEALHSKPITECLQMIVNETSRLLNMPNVAIAVHSEGEWETVAVSSASDEFAHQIISTNDNSIIKKVFSKKEPLCSDAADETGDLSLTTLFQGTQSFIAAPLCVEYEVKGILVAESPCKDEIVSNYKPLLKRFADLSAIALRNFRNQNISSEFEDCYKILAEGSQAGVYLTDNNSFRYVNPAFAHIFGYEPHELIGKKNLFDLVSHDGKDGLIEKFQDCISRKNKTEACRFKAVKKDGSLCFVEIYGTRFIDKGEQIVLGTILDITEREMFDGQLRNTLKELADVKHALDSFAIVGITDQRGRITYVNDKFCEISKYSREELLGQDHRLINSGYHSKKFIKNLWATVAKGKIWHEEIKNRAKDGSFFWTDTTIVPFLNEHGKPYQYVIIRNDITEKKKTEEKIKEKKEHLQIALESAELGEWSLDLDSSVMNGSDVCKDILGLSQYTEITAEEFMRIIHPEDRVTVREAFTNALEANKDIHVNYRVMWTDGSIHWIVCSGRCIYDDNGNQKRIVGVICDYTKRKTAEDELTNKSRQLQLALEAGNLSIFQIDLHTGLIETSPLLKKLFGFPVDKPVTLEDVYNCTHPEDKAWSHKVRMEAINNCEDYSLEYRIVWKDGSVRWVSTNTHCISGENGKPVCLIGVCQDITRQKQTENELKRLALVAQKTQNAVLITDIDLRIKWINEGFTRMFGYELDEVYDQPPSDFLIGPNTDFKILYEIQEAVKDRVEYTCELYNYSKKRHGFWNNLALAPILDEDNLEGNIFILSDLTERKLFEEELAKAHDAALESSKLKSQFLANISHEIRTPLNGVIGMTELLLNTELNEEQKQYADMVCLSAETLLRLINEILDLSKIEAGKFSLEKVNFNLQEIIEEIFDQFSEKARKKKIAFASIIDRFVPVNLKGDPYRLKQVLNNLISNALKFTHEGHVSLGVKGEKYKDGKVELRFAISDTGIGISSEDCAQIFEPFTQADGSMTRKYGGTGLGLSISKQLIELTGGEINVESEPGAGSTFQFNAFYEEDEFAKKAADSNALAGKKALIIESKNYYEHILKQQLESVGVSYSIVETPFDVESYLETFDEDYDFVICTSPNPSYIFDRLATLRRKNHTQPLMVFFYGDDVEIKETSLSTVSINYTVLTLPIRQSDFLKTLKGVKKQNVKVAKNKNTTSVMRPRPDAKIKVLVVEDTPANQQVAMLMLSRLGCNVDICDNGGAALEAIEKNNYDLVFMDCQMPVMDGYEATKELRRREEGSENHSIIVAMTAHALPVDKEKCLSAGMDDYLSKPVKQKDLIGILEKWCADESEEEQNMHIQETSNTPFALELFERLDDLSLFLEATDLSDIIDQFILDAPVLLEELTDAIAAKDFQQAKKSAHSLKGSLANIGSARLAECCAEIEEHAKNNCLNYVEESYSQLKEHWGEIIEVLSTYKNKLSE